jgi:hypothetical protein
VHQERRWQRRRFCFATDLTTVDVLQALEATRRLATREGWRYQPTPREPAKTKAELREVLAEAVRNTQPQTETKPLPKASAIWLLSHLFPFANPARQKWMKLNTQDCF